MKKKIGELTLREMAYICHKNQPCDGKCCLFNVCTFGLGSEEVKRMFNTTSYVSKKGNKDLKKIEKLKKKISKLKSEVDDDE